MQKELPLFAVLHAPAAIERSIVEGFKSTGEAVKLAFDHRTDAGGKSVEWIAKHLGIKRQRLSRILNHGDYKLDASQVMLFDCLVGNKAVSQYIELEEERLQQAIAETIQQAVKARFAA